MKLSLIRKVYPLKYPFKLSYGTFTERVGYLVKLEEGGYTGWGEMSVVPYYNKDEGIIKKEFEDSGRYLSTVSEDWTPEDLYDEMGAKLPLDPFIRSAVDCALYDLYGKKHGKSTWRLVGGKEKVPVLSSLTITEDDWEEKLDWEWPILKLKMGFRGDIQLLTKIRKKFDGVIRIDANSGWNQENMEKNLAVMKDLEIELIEQPVPKNEDIFLSEFDPGIPFVADESFQGLENLLEMNQRYQVINVKLQKCGGITPALRIIEKAKAMDLKIMAGCMTESSIGIGAICQLAGYFDYLDVDGEYLIDFNFQEALFLNKGFVLLDDKPGMGKNYIL